MKLTSLVFSVAGAALLLTGSACRKGPSGTGHLTNYTQIDTANGATITGKIHFTKPAPKRIEIDMAQDPACAMSGSNGSGSNMSEQYVVNHGGLANVFIYVKDGLGNKVYPITRAPIVIDQKGCRYTPHVSGAMVGQQVQFMNSDPTMHNVHITPTAGGNEAFDISQGPNSGSDSRQFHAPELMIPLRCNNHPWMQAYLNVVDNPFFAVSDSNGSFTITGLPPGTYTLVADHEQLGTETATITISAKQHATQDFTYGNRSSTPGRP
jgi:plastocyanin